METVAPFRSSLSTLPSHIRAAVHRPHFLRVGSKSFLSNGSIQQRPAISRLQLGGRKCNAIRAYLRPSDSGGPAASNPIAPLKMESPIGQFLSEILVSHPHLLSAAAEKQLEQLQMDRDAENDKEDVSSSTGSELVLYRRIAQVKANERRKALEEILYALVVQKFMDAKVSLIPTIAPSSPANSGQVDTWPCQEEMLERLHSSEAYEMIQSHLALILGNRLGDSDSVAQISKLKVGQVYAASVMYGYFLKRLDERFQLEKTVKTLPQGICKENSSIQQFSAQGSDEAVRNAQPQPEVSSWSGSIGALGGIKPSRLRNYVMMFDGETLQRYATIRSKEAINIIEKHTEALFGRPELVITPDGTIDSSKDESIKISFGGLRRLVLEATTFGSFLWDVESYVDSRYHFVAN